MVILNMYSPDYLPRWLVEGVRTVGFALVLLGWADIAKAEGEHLLDLLKNWLTSSVGGGMFLQFLNVFLDNLPEFSELFPKGLNEALTAISYLLIAMGVRKMIAGARVSPAMIDAK